MLDVPAVFENRSRQMTWSRCFPLTAVLQRLPAWGWVLGTAVGFGSAFISFAWNPAPRRDQPHALYAPLHQLIGDTLAGLGRNEEAASRYEQSLKADPDYKITLDTYANLLVVTGKAADALPLYEKALAISPHDGVTLCNYGCALVSLDRLGHARPLLEQGLKRHPTSGPALSSLSWVLAVIDDDSIRDPARALTLAEQVLAMNGQGDILGLRSLAAANAGLGKYMDAAAIADRAAEILAQAGRQDFSQGFRAQADHYRSGKDLRIPASPAP